jgi:1-acyl-sn-glycerol-3-phosphate acyltransferase
MAELDSSVHEEVQSESTSPAAPAQTNADRYSERATAGKKHGWPSRLRSYFVFDPLIWFYTVVLGIISIPFGFFRDHERILHRFSRFWSQLIMRTISSPVQVTGLEKIDHTRPQVYAVNHASALDIPVLYACLPFQFRIVFKKELLSYPIIGWHLRRSGQVCINQQNTVASLGSVRSALKGLKQGMPLVIFPEGGRTNNGQIKSFMPGAFFLAIKAQVEIVPIALVGTHELLPMNTYHIKCRPLEMRVGEPIPTAGLKGHDIVTLSAKVQKAMEDLYYSSSAPRTT